MQDNISTVLKTANQYKDNGERIQYLRQNGSFALKTILQYNFDPRLQSILPPGAPPFKRMESKEADNSKGFIHHEVRKLYLFIKRDPPDNLTRTRREYLFIQILEGIPGEDADVLVAAKDKQLSKVYKKITEKVVKEAFPDLFPNV